MDEELDLLDLFYVFLRKKWWLVGAVLVGILCGVLYTAFIVTPKYTSSVTLILSKPTAEFTSSAASVNDPINQSDILLNQKLISTYSEIMKSKRIAATVIDNLGLDMEYEVLKEGISVASVKDTDVMKFSITTTDPVLSADIATEMTEVFSGEIVDIYKIQNISIIDPAEIEDEPVNVSYAKSVVIFALIAFIMAAGGIFVVYYFDNSIRDDETIQKLIGVPVLAMIPKFDDCDKEGK